MVRVSAAGAVSGEGSLPPLTRRQSRLLLFGIHLAVAFVHVGLTASIMIEEGAPWWTPTSALVLGVVPMLLNLRHSLAFASGRRPAGWYWTLTAMIVILAVPIPWWPYMWTYSGVYVIASAGLLLPGWAAVATTAVALTVNVGWYFVHFHDLWMAAGGWLWVVAYGLYALGVSVAGAAALFLSAWLTRALAELSAARAALAEAAVQGERRRILRDLHDLLGQSLSAVSLKGDLALRLLPRDPEAARAEMIGLVSVARTAIRDARTVARDTRRVSLRTEIDGAVALLAAAGVQADVRLAEEPMSSQVEELLAWAVREGTTNMLRHSEARRCWMRVDRQGDRVRLEMVNDGARAGGGEGSGLAGLSDRARALAGSVRSGLIGGGRFRLAVEAFGGDR
ncbi:sensor histidine kinase [Plantactinospora sp. GCM10030261]|uniref:sensor histidine kinase n=1 Tax=Plantactinospora sp. GCM10030261 TaxID=3273420 RepID=UPI0036151F5C